MCRNRLRIRGFSLLELMVGMVLGLIVVLVIMQSLAVSEGYKRTMATGGDAQNTGILTLRTLESEIRMAGYGLMNKASMCPTINKYYDGDSNLVPAGVSSSTSMPVKIVDGGTAGASDTIEIFYSSSSTGAMPTHITKDMPTPANVTKVSTLAGMNTCDMVMYASTDGSKACTVLQITGLEQNNIQFQTGSGQSDFNPSGGGNVDLFPPGGYSTNDVIINMGSFVDRRYQVAKTTGKDEYFFQRVNLAGDQAAGGNCNVADPNPILNMYGNVVNIQAQYGVAPLNSQQVNCWTNAGTTDNGCSITGGKKWSSPDPVDVNRIKAIRVALVVRSQLAEKPSSGANCDTTTTAPTSWDGGPAIDLSSDANWKCYRYKVYQTVIPMLNVIWGNL